MAISDPDTSSSPPRAVVVGPGEGETIRSPLAGELTFLARGEQTNGALSAFEVAVPPGQGPPLPVHAREDESVWVLEGDLRFKLDGEVRSTPPGSFVFIPHGVAHCFQNIGTQAGRFLVTITPAGLERFFERLSEPTVDPESFRRAGADEGITVVGPPLAESDPPNR